MHAPIARLQSEEVIVKEYNNTQSDMITIYAHMCTVCR